MRAHLGAGVLLAGVALTATPTLGQTPPAQASPPGFVAWSASELASRNEALGTRIGADGSARETLADYRTPSGSHRFRFIRRDRDGRPEQHDDAEDVVLVQSGAGTVLVGGEMLGRQGEVGDEIRGGARYPIAAGDVLRIPSGTPHAYLVGDAGHITYVLVRIPAFRGEVVRDPDGEAPRLDPAGFGLWRASELREREARLATMIREDGSARETLADYGSGGTSHRFRFLRRDSDGRPEVHEDIIDVVFVQSGAGAVLVGGEMRGASNAPGSTISGAERHPVAAGDVLHIPAQVPHAYVPQDGDHITYVLVRVPAVVP